MGTHYIPQEYLRGFEDGDAPGELWQYDKQKGSVRRVPVAAVAQQAGYFDADTESLLSCNVEGRGHAALKSLRTDRKIPTPDERKWFTLYVATMLMRTPRRRRKAWELVPRALEDTIDEFNSLIDKWAEGGGDPELVTRRRREAELARVRFRADPPEAAMEQIRSPWPTERVVGLIYQMTWRIITSTGPQYFLTGDNPAFFFESYGIAQPESELTFPLGRDLALVGNWQGDPRTSVMLTTTQPIVREINRRIVAGSERFVFSSKPQAWVKTVAEKSRPYLSRIRW
jgi:hypothetical protein